MEERAAAAASGAPTTPRQRAAQRMATYLSTTKQKDRTPLLVKVSGPGELPRYEGRVRPASELKGPRRPPKMATQALGIPLLRYARPGPIAWRNRVCQQVNLWQGRVDAIRTAEADWVVWGALEDRWDEAMQAEMARAGVKPDPRDRADGHETSWIWSPLLSKLWYENRLEHMWNDWVARGEAMHRIVKEETALAVAEGAMTPEQASPLYRRPRSKRSKGRAGTGGLQPLADMLEPKQQQQQQAQNKSQKKQKQKQTQARGPPVPANMVIDKRNRAPAVTAEMDAMRDLYLRRGKAAPPTREGDMFAHPVWTATVKNAHGRVLGWAKRAPTGRDRTQLPASIAYGGRDANSGPASAGQSSFFL